MKAALNRIVWVVAIILASVATANAQSTPDDSELGTAHDLHVITNEWNAWFNEPTSENAYIGDFMDEFAVPQSGQNGLNRLETWYWWASHHPAEVNEYVERRDDELGEQE
jgi:hypothetical protein